MQYLLVGNYGVGNAGDEILKEYFLKRFPEVQWRVCSAKPLAGELPRIPCGIRSLLCTRWGRTLVTLRRADGLVFGGGSLFTDMESPHACFVWFTHAVWAVWFRKPIFLAFQGIGPFRTRRGKWLARFVVRHAVYISVRDTTSLSRLLEEGARTESCDTPRPLFGMRSIQAHVEVPALSGVEVPALSGVEVPALSGVEVPALSGVEVPALSGVEVWKKNTQIVQSFDPSILLLKGKKTIKRTKNVFIVIPRFSTQWTRESKHNFAAILQKVQKQGSEVRLISFQSDNGREWKFCQELGAALDIHTDSVSTLHDAVSSMDGATCVITQRYHGIIAAIACDVPFIALRYRDGDKMDALATMFGCHSALPGSLTEDSLLSTDWTAMQERIHFLFSQHVRLVSQGEQTLRIALERYCNH